MSPEPADGATVLLLVHVEDWGCQEIALRLPSRPLQADVRFSEPAMLTIEPAPGPAMTSDRFSLLVRDRWRTEIVTSGACSAEGCVTLGPVQPGTYILNAVTEEPFWKQSIELGGVTLASGRQSRRVRLPHRHPVTIRWRRELGNWLRLTKADGGAQAGANGVPDGDWLSSGSLLLPDGTYSARVGGVTREVTITAPAVIHIDR
jgi:hypothetical protein